MSAAVAAPEPAAAQGAAAYDAPVEGAGVGYGEALRSREFRALFAGQAIAIAGMSVAGVALTVLVYRRTGSPFLSSLTFALGFLPYLAGGLLSSVVDRVRPRRLVNAASLGSAGIAALMAWPGTPVAVLLVLLFCLGTLSSLSGGASRTLVRATVSDAGYVPARSLLKVASQGAQIGGTAVGGAVVVTLGTSGALLLNAATYATAFALVRLGVRDHPSMGAAAAVGLVRDSLAGAREVFRQRELARLLLLGWLVPTFWVAPEALAAPYVAGEGGSATLVGWWLAALPAGMIAGDLLAVRFLRPRTQRRLVEPAAAGCFLPYLAFPLHPPIAVALCLLVVSGACGMYSLGLDGRIRDAAPDELFPRTMVLESAGLMTLQGLGFALAGAIGEGVGPALAVGIAGVLGLATVAALVAVPRRLGGTSEGAPNLSS